MAGRYLSHAVNVVCKIAAGEAAAAESANVEPLHLLIGICSLEKLFSPSNLRKGFSRSELDRIGVEWSLTMSVLTDAAINPIVLRRRLRGPTSSTTSSEGVMFLDQSGIGVCPRCWRRAEESNSYKFIYSAIKLQLIDCS
jgi:hypothetical protein